MSVLLEPITIKSITFPNRLGMSPMCQYSSENGFANDWHLVHYGSRAVGGTGMIMLEAAAVSPEGRITPYDLGLWDDEHVDALQRITNFIHEQGSVSAIQIAHAGRKASHDAPVRGGKQLTPEQGGWQTLAPWAIPFEPSEVAPLALDLQGIDQVISDFQNAARRAYQAGFQVLEIHAAHGYLMHQFLSPLSNMRTDVYGGSFENRIRLLLEVVEAVKIVWPDVLPLFVRLSATDWTTQGWTLDQTVMLARILKNQGVDLVDCSSGGNVYNAKIPVAPGYQVAFAEAVRATGILSASVGLLTRPEQMEQILIENKCDFVLLGRELLRNPYFAIAQLPENDMWPVQYLRSK